MSRSNLADVDYDFIKIDDPQYDSVLFVIDGKDVWLPRSQIEIDTDDNTIAMPQWLAEDEEIV